MLACVRVLVFSGTHLERFAAVEIRRGLNRMRHIRECRAMRKSKLELKGAVFELRVRLG